MHGNESISRRDLAGFRGSGKAVFSKNEGVLVFKAHRLLYPSTVGSRVMKKRKTEGVSRS